MAEKDAKIIFSTTTSSMLKGLEDDEKRPVIRPNPGRSMTCEDVMKYRQTFPAKGIMKVENNYITRRNGQDILETVTEGLIGMKIPLNEIDTVVNQVIQNGRVPEGIFLQFIESPINHGTCTVVISGYDTNNCQHHNSYREYFNPCPNDCPDNIDGSSTGVCAIAYDPPL